MRGFHHSTKAQLHQMTKNNYSAYRNSALIPLLALWFLFYCLAIVGTLVNHVSGSTDVIVAEKNNTGARH